ncbi:prepilin-type N-terminal cleavage/methylation domain-containing protein [Miniphocaeibacter halophilus]|uniref:prepilin-type N-terminal cleavage/methylation domain-containing protein n=1 Tax=Miniphocaeibacter halophilus TaxID=2931922 RepID=UPI0023DEE58C|nr:prepilin-type N-terminal cleavage/methylation domain-containing protein [Miniphocaeibacter halophilus]
MNRFKNKKFKGFTLIELIVVIAILAILAAIAIPKYKESRQKSLVTAHNSNVRILESAALNYIANDGGKDVTWEGPDSAKEYIAEYPKVPKGIKGLEGKGDNYYIVKITATGDVTVDPGKIKEE